MSIEATYQRLSPAEFRRVTATPKAWQEFGGSGVAGFSVDEFLNASQNPNPEFSAKILAAFEQRQNDPNRVEIGKNWHVIYYLLTGESKIAEEHRERQALHNLIFGGRPTAVQSSYGPVRYFGSDEIAEIITALSALDHTVVESRFAPETFKRLRIYAAPDADEKDYIFEDIKRLQELFAQAHAVGDHILVYAH